MATRPLSPEAQATLDAIRARFTAPANPYTGHQDPQTGAWIQEGPHPDLLARLWAANPAARAIAEQHRGSGSNPTAIAAAKWNWQMLQYLSGRGPHPGPHPIAGVDSQLPPQPPANPPPAQPPAQPGMGPKAPGQGLLNPDTAPPFGSTIGPVGGTVTQGTVGVPPFGSTIVPAGTGGGIGQNPVSVSGVPVAPVGATSVPGNPGPVGSATNSYLNYLLGRKSGVGGPMGV